MAEKRAMGLGEIGNPSLKFKRQFRFTFEINGFCNNASNRVPEHFVQVAARPNLQIEETQIDFLNARTWIPGKGSWETITVEYLDVAHASMGPLWSWLATVYDFTDPVNLRMGEKIDWNATGILSMWSGCGDLLETWEMGYMFPTGIDFGAVDQSSNEIARIALTLRFSNVRVKNYCPGYTIQSCCSGCA